MLRTAEMLLLTQIATRAMTSTGKMKVLKFGIFFLFKFFCRSQFAPQFGRLKCHFSTGRHH